MKYSKNDIVNLGVDKLKTFGFVHVNSKNIFEDEVYKYHFKKFMQILNGQDDNLDAAVKELLTTLEK